MSVTPTPRTGRRKLRLSALAQAICTPLIPQDYLDLVAPLHGSELRGRIESVTPETRDSATLVITPGRAWRGHDPGQYIRLGVDVNGVRLWRAYSVTSAPEDRRAFTITVKAMPDGVVSQHLVHTVTPGTLVQLDQASGDFTLASPPPAKLLFVTAGSGVTPVMGILRSRLDGLGDVVHLHAAPSAGDAIFRPELRGLARQGRLTLIENHDDIHGQLTPERLRGLVSDLSERETWACGPIGLLNMLENLYAEQGIADKLHTERFRAAFIATGDGGTLAFTRQGITTQAPASSTILDAAEAAGMLMPSGCRMGVCFGCVVPLHEGAVRDLRNGELTLASPGDDVHIQTCINAAAGPCSFDL